MKLRPTATLILVGVLLVATARAQDIKMGTLFDHSGALQDWGPRHPNTAELAARQMRAAGDPDAGVADRLED